MTNSIKKKLILRFKVIGYSLWTIIYGKIKGVIDSENHDSIKVVKSLLNKDISYKIFKIKNCRIYTDTINDTAFITENKIIKGPSFQIRNVKNADINENIVFNKGTPNFKRKLSGSVFSLLTGGAGNANYWHWLFDVLPRLKIIEKKIELKEIDYFLFPDLKEKFQTETLDILNIPLEKRISSRIYRHIHIGYAYAVSHPYVFKNNPSIEIQNMPSWILDYLRTKFLKNKFDKKFPEKFYIDRSDSKSNHRHLRQIINEDEIKEFLKNKGFSIITLSNLSFQDQVNLFNNAKQIVGLHGAGFANLTFCRPNTLALELKPKSAGPVCANLAKKINLKYRDISVEPTKYSNNDQQGLISVPLNLLEKKIS